MTKTKKGKKYTFNFEKRRKIKKIGRRGNTKKIVKLLILIIVIGVACLIGGFFFVGQIGDEKDADITWKAEIGDKFYFKVFDNYYKSINNEQIENYEMILKSEIIDVRDLTLDKDKEDDLLIMSSWLLGDGEMYPFKFPNYFDMYDLFIMLQNDYLSENTENNLGNASSLTEWGIPSAVHTQTSQLYQYLNDLIRAYKCGELNVSITEFEQIDNLLEWITLKMEFDDDFKETFEDDIIGQPPQNLSYITDSGNELEIQESNSNQMLNLTLNDINPTNTTIYKDLFDSIEKNKTINLKEYWYNLDEFSFDFQLSDINNMKQEFYFQLKTDDYNLSGNVMGESQDFSGINGLNMRVHNGIIQYKIGDYIYDGSNIRESFSNEKGWNNLYPSFNLSEYYANDEVLNFKIEFQKDNPYVFNFGIHRPENSYSLISGSNKENIPLYFDCPYDYELNECYDNVNEEYCYFKKDNFTNLDFRFEKESSTGISALLDNIRVKGDLYYYSNTYENLIEDFVFSQLYLFSIYHTLIYPNELSSDVLIDLCNIVNKISEELLNISDFIIYENQAHYLKIQIPYNALNGLRKIFNTYFLENMNLKLKGFIEGNIDLQINLLFDKRINCMNESYMRIKYRDLGLYREVGLELDAVSNKDREAKYGDLYNNLTDTYFDNTLGEIKQARNDIIISNLLISIATTGGIIGIIEILKYVIKRKRKSII
jgi:hypothetical protein